MNFAADLPPLISDLERVSQLPDSENLADLQQSLLHRQEVLLKVKDYLVFLHGQGNDASGSAPAALTGVEAIANAVIQELQIKRTEWVAPISQEVDQLNAQKQMLEREIYRLNQQYDSILQQFPQQLLAHFQALLQTQLSKAVELFEQRLRYISSVTHPIQGLEDAGFATSEARLTDKEYQPAEQIQIVQKHLDEALLNLDQTIRSVFGSLEKDVTAYQASLTDNLSRLHILGTGAMPVAPVAANDAESQKVHLEPTPEPAEAIALPELDTPELQTLLQLEPVEQTESHPETLAGESLFGAEALAYEPEPATAIASNDPLELAPITTPVTSVQEQYFDFVASVAEANLTEADLFGDRPEPSETEDPPVNLFEEEVEPIPTESFLFGDPITPPEPEIVETPINDLQAVIAAPKKLALPTANTANTDSQNTTVKTIQLLTDLLEDGALNIQEEEVVPETEAEEQTEVIEAKVSVEDLSPDLDLEDAAEEALNVTALAPEQIDQLAADLSRFEGSTSEPPITLDVAFEAETEATDESNPAPEEVRLDVVLDAEAEAKEESSADPEADGPWYN